MSGDAYWDTFSKYFSARCGELSSEKLVNIFKDFI
jgi:N-glycosylase/DNA lyase